MEEVSNQAGFLELGVTHQLVGNDEEKTMMWHVIDDGRIVKTCKIRGTALIELAGLIDKKMGT